VRWFANSVCPIALVVVAVSGLLLSIRRKGVLQHLAAALPGAWTGALAAAWIAFPVSALIFAPPALIGALFFYALYGTAYRRRLLPRVSVGLAFVLSAAFGAALPLTQRGPDPGTVPIHEALPPVELSDRAEDAIPLGENLRLYPSSESVESRRGALTLRIRPLLTFVSRSPDRCWTLFATRRHRRGRPRKITGVTAEPGWAWLALRDEGEHRIHVEGRPAERACRITAISRLPETVYSHLNRYCEIDVTGHRRLSISFSPCPKSRFEAPYSRYPFGRPARSAHLSADDRFRVVEARSGEKGPFRELASGSMGRGDPLIVTLHDEDRAVARITFEDWARHADVTLSPTAGWGLPSNSVSFRRDGRSPTEGVTIRLTLAATGVGLGWDSVGHAAGTYRNRMTVEQLGD
jgi:hypothetical protein